MQIDLLVWRIPFLELPTRPLEGWLLLAIYLAVTSVALAGTRHTWTRFTRRQWLWLALLCLLAVLLNSGLAWHYPIARPPVPNRPQEASGLPVPLLGGLPLLLAGAWLGAGPALVVGLLAGLVRTLFISGQLTDLFHLALLGLTWGYLLQQDYAGRLSAIGRHPLVAGVLGRLLLWPITFFSIFIYASEGDPLWALDYTWPLFLSGLLPALVEGSLAGLLGWAICRLFPALRPERKGRAVPPYARSLNRRLLFTFVPLMLVIIIVLVYAVAATTVSAATQQAMRQMSRDAVGASQEIPFFFQTGQSLLSTLAEDDRLRSSDAAVRQNKLAEGVRAGAFFDEMLLTDATAQVLNVYPATAPNQLTEEEKALVLQAAASAAPGVTSAQRRSDAALTMSFVVPIERQTSGRAGVLVGRARLNMNPTMTRALAGLQNTLGTGNGFVVDERGQMVLSPNATRLLAKWEPDASQPPLAHIDGGQVYINSVEDGTRRLIHVRPVEGHPWTTVIELPYAAVLGLAAQVSAPLLILLVTLMFLASLVMFLVSRAVTQPVRQLSEVAAHIAEGKLEQTVEVRGEGEVGQLADVFEQMRASLKGRLDDLSLLLHVSQEVAASFDLDRGLPPVLDGALAISGAFSARLVLTTGEGRPLRVWKRGDLPDQLLPLDQRLVELTKNSTGPLLFENLARVRSTLEPTLIPPGLRSIAALPVRRQAESLGVLWLGYGEPHHFLGSEKSVMTTLTGQTAVLVENAQLFHAVESERQRLAAILTSTGDAVIVTSSTGRVLLMNPAAEIAFGVVATRIVGKRIAETVIEPAVIQLLTLPAQNNNPQTGEVILPNGHTLYGIASDIRMGEGPSLGRVAVLRDITRFKEIDSMKSDFVATVSHDLRSPLTYMRGYAAMLPMVGELSSKQKEYVEKIQGGIEQMTELVDDLLDLGRIEAGVGLQRVECVLADIVTEVVEEVRGRALAFNLDLRTEINTQHSAQVDPALIKRAINNLLDNAIKYTPSGGRITAGIDQRADLLILRVSDTGIGIAATDQGQLFEKFYRVKRRDTLDIKGTGLGLAIVKSIAEWHGGRVWVDSQLGIGSTFYLALPLS